MKKYPSIRYPGEPETDGLLDGDHDIIVMEKVDGANFRFSFNEDGDILIGSRNIEYGDDRENLDKSFEHALQYLEHIFAGWELPDWATDVVFYGEAMHRHTIDYDAYSGEHPHPTEEDCPNVVVFDAEALGSFVSHDRLMELLSMTPLTHVPIIDIVPSEEFEPYDIPPSHYRSEDEEADSEFDARGLAEGVVYKRSDGQVRAKQVHESFKEKHKGGGGAKDFEQTPAGEFVNMYVTEGRIRDVAQTLVERPDTQWESLQMEMMEDLPRAVLQDAMAENGWDLLTNDFEFEFDSDFKGEVRSKSSKKCARVLKEEISTF